MLKVLELALGLDEDSSRYVLAGLFALTVGYTLLAGLLGVVLTDALQFALVLGGCVLLAIFAVGDVGGLGALLSSLSERGDTLRMVPLPSDGEAFWAFVIYVGIKSWASGNTEGNGWWEPVARAAGLPHQRLGARPIFEVLAATIGVYAALLGTGWMILGSPGLGASCVAVALLLFVWVVRGRGVPQPQDFPTRNS